MSSLSPSSFSSDEGYIKGFISGFLFFAILFAGVMIKWPTDDERKEMMEELRFRRLKDMKDTEKDDEVIDAEKADNAQEGDADAAVAVVGAVDPDETEPPPPPTPPSLSPQTSANNPPPSNPLLPTKTAAPQPTPSQNYKTILSLTSTSTHWSKKTSVQTILFLTEFQRIHERYKKDIGKLRGVAETVCSFSDRRGREGGSGGGGNDSGEAGAALSTSPSNPNLNSQVDANDESWEPSAWSSISSLLSSLSNTTSTLIKTVEMGPIKTIKHLKFEQEHLILQITKEVTEGIRRKDDAEHNLYAAIGIRDKAQVKTEVLLKSVAESCTTSNNGGQAVDGSNSNKELVTSGLKSFVSKITKKGEVDEKGATETSKKLFKRLMECEHDVTVAQNLLKSVTASFNRQLPDYIRDINLLEDTRRDAVQGMTLSLGTSFLEMSADFVNAGKRLVVDCKGGYGGGGIESLVDEGVAEFNKIVSLLGEGGSGNGSGSGDVSNNTSSDANANSDVSANVNVNGIDMTSDSICALIALAPSSLPPLSQSTLSSASLKGLIKTETTVWLNTFTSRIYRDASTSHKFIATFKHLLNSQLNKGSNSRPNYIGKINVVDLKLGDVPPVFKNATYVYPGVIGGVDLEHDCCVDIDFIYRSHTNSSSNSNSNSNGSSNFNSANPNMNTNTPNTNTSTTNHKSGIQFTINTNFWIGSPETGLTVPIKISFKLTELTGKLRLGVRKDKCFLSFLTTPNMKFDVSSEIGQSLFLRDAPFVERGIIRLVKKTVEKKMVWPKVVKLKLLWPKAWWPDFRGEEGVSESWGKSEGEFRAFVESKKREEERRKEEQAEEREKRKGDSEGESEGKGGEKGERKSNERKIDEGKDDEDEDEDDEEEVEDDDDNDDDIPKTQKKQPKFNKQTSDGAAASTPSESTISQPRPSTPTPTSTSTSTSRPSPTSQSSSSSTPTSAFSYPPQQQQGLWKRFEKAGSNGLNKLRFRKSISESSSSPSASASASANTSAGAGIRRGLGSGLQAEIMARIAKDLIEFRDDDNINDKDSNSISTSISTSNGSSSTITAQNNDIVIDGVMLNKMWEETENKESGDEDSESDDDGDDDDEDSLDDIGDSDSDGKTKSKTKSISKMGDGKGVAMGVGMRIRTLSDHANDKLMRRLSGGGKVEMEDEIEIHEGNTNDGDGGGVNDNGDDEEDLKTSNNDNADSEKVQAGHSGMTTSKSKSTTPPAASAIELESEREYVSIKSTDLIPTRVSPPPPSYPPPLSPPNVTRTTITATATASSPSSSSSSSSSSLSTSPVITPRRQITLHKPHTPSHITSTSTTTKKGYLNQNVMNGIGIEMTNLLGLKRYITVALVDGVCMLYVDVDEKQEDLRAAAANVDTVPGGGSSAGSGGGSGSGGGGRGRYVINQCICRPSLVTTVGLEIVIPRVPLAGTTTTTTTAESVAHDKAATTTAAATAAATATATASGEGGGEVKEGKAPKEKEKADKLCLYFTAKTPKSRDEWLFFIQHASG